MYHQNTHCFYFVVRVGVFPFVSLLVVQSFALVALRPVVLPLLLYRYIPPRRNSPSPEEDIKECADALLDRVEEVLVGALREGRGADAAQDLDEFRELHGGRIRGVEVLHALVGHLLRLGR